MFKRNVVVLNSTEESRATESHLSFGKRLLAIKWGLIFLRVVIASIIAVPVITVIALSPIVGLPLYNGMLFHPWKYPLGDYVTTTINGIKPTDVYFKSKSGNKLHAFLYKVAGAKRIVLTSHGNGGNVGMRGYLAARLIRTGNSVLSYDYSGYGRSEGTPTTEGICQDVRGAYDYLINEEHYAAKQIVLYGESLGTIVTGNLASTVDCAAVILECPIFSLKRIACDQVPFLAIYPDWAWTQGALALDNSHAMSKLHVPLLIIAGTADTLTPIRYADDLFALAPSPKCFVRIEGGGHGDLVMSKAPEYDLQLKQFLQELN